MLEISGCDYSIAVLLAECSTYLNLKSHFPIELYPVTCHFLKTAGNWAQFHRKIDQHETVAHFQFLNKLCHCWGYFYSTGWQLS